MIFKAVCSLVLRSPTEPSFVINSLNIYVKVKRCHGSSTNPVYLLFMLKKFLNKDYLLFSSSKGSFRDWNTKDDRLKGMTAYHATRSTFVSRKMLVISKMFIVRNRKDEQLGPVRNKALPIYIRSGKCGIITEFQLKKTFAQPTICFCFPDDYNPMLFV